MNTAPLTPSAAPAEATRLAAGMAVGLAAANIGALYTVCARWGIAQGLHASDLTALRFGAGLLMLPLEVLVQGVIAGAGTLFTCATMGRLLGPARAAVFPALAPGLPVPMAWPVLGHVPNAAAAAGIVVVVMAGLIFVFTPSSRRTA